MKTVNPYETTGAISALYAGAKPPFFVAHSKAEFKQIIEDDGGTPIILYNVLDFTALIKRLNYLESSKSYSLDEHNVWICTGELFVPDRYIETGQILYALDKGKPVTTDGVYIRVYGFVGYNSMFSIATSSGLFNISALKWDVSGALKYNYKIVEADRLKFISTSAGNSKKVIESKRTKVGDLRFVYYMLFADMDTAQAARKAYGSYMKVEDVKKLRSTDRIKKILVKELGVIIPSLPEEILKQYSIEEIAKDMRQVVKKTMEKNADQFNHKDAIEAINFVLDNSVKAPAILGAPQDQPLVEGRKVTTIGQTVIHSADGEITNLLAKKLDTTERATVLSEQEVRKTENDLGVPIDGYVMSDSPAYLVEPDKLFPDEKIDGQS
jgi:hypothetical protein